MHMESEDEFERAAKKQRHIFDKENMHPNIKQSPLLIKLDEISFNSDDFENGQECGSRKLFQKLFEDIPVQEVTPTSVENKKVRKRSPKQMNKQPYDSIRKQRSGMTMFEMVERTNSPEKVVSFLQEHGCLATEMLCPKCECSMHLGELSNKNQAFYFQCNKRHGKDKRCRQEFSVTKNSFFFKAHISLFSLVWLLWGFCEGMENNWFIRHLGLSSRTVVDWLNFCREVCMVCIQGNSKQIGGFGFIVEIDESKFVKRKYNKGKAKKCEDWVLGGICRETGQIFMRIVKYRKRETLEQIILEYVKPGTVILTDCWAAYNNLKGLEGMDYTHYTVNHSDTYVDPITGAHTNTIEGTWAHFKNAPHQGLV